MVPHQALPATPALGHAAARRPNSRRPSAGWSSTGPKHDSSLGASQIAHGAQTRWRGEFLLGGAVGEDVGGSYDAFFSFFFCEILQELARVDGYVIRAIRNP